MARLPSQLHLVVYEFKPDNDKAKRKGEEQVEGYLSEVAEYYENSLRMVETPDGDHGGMKMLIELKKAENAWSDDDGERLQATPTGDQYHLCDKKFN